jgi:hypothetical protein
MDEELDDDYEMWTTATGERVRVSDMTTSHIVNARRMVADMNNPFPMFGGEMSQYYADMAYDRAIQEQQDWLDVFD